MFSSSHLAIAANRLCQRKQYFFKVGAEINQLEGAFVCFMLSSALRLSIIVI